MPEKIKSSEKQLMINPIRQHMEQQSNANDSGNSFEKQQQNINPHRPISMQKMKVDAVAVGRKYWCTEQMIGIYKHRSQHYEICLSPVLPKKSVCNRNWKNQVEKVVNRNPERKKL